MSIRAFPWLLAACLAVIGGQSAQCEPPTPKNMKVGQGSKRPASQQPTAEVIDKLIRQLGSRKFSERKEATKRLLSIGEPCLPALRKAAAASKDVEVQLRARQLVRKIDGIV